MSGITINQQVILLLRSEILRCIKELLEKKHLYQVLRLDTAPIKKMIDEADKSHGVKEAEKRARRLNNAIAPPRSGSGHSPENYVADAIKKYRQEIDSTVSVILDKFWTFSTDAYDHLVISSGGKVSESITHFSLPTISVACAQCNAILPAHNSGFRGLRQDIQSISWMVTKGDQQLPYQSFVFPYHCQSCKKEPLVFLVHREGIKLTLTGRNHFETIQVPKTIPKEESAFLSDAIAAYNTGNILAGLFLLRTTIEQYMRRLLAITGKKTGDELAEEYARILDDEFPKKYPSLKVIYDELSAYIHAADSNAPQFEKSRKDIERHFELLSHFPLKTIGANNALQPTA